MEPEHNAERDAPNKETDVPKTLACPECGSVDLDTLEVATCIAECDSITTDGPTFGGFTDYERGYQDTIGVYCNTCAWEYPLDFRTRLLKLVAESEDWLTKLVQHNDGGADA